jgi:hypothetical protein
MTTTNTLETATSAASLGASEPADAKKNAITLSSALTDGSRAYANGILELGRTLGGFGREITAEAGRHIRATIEARSLREVAELQAAWAQHRVETSTAHVKELADLTHTKTMDVIAPFAALLKQPKAT